MKADLHIHSHFSADSVSKPESILATAADRGIGLIAVTDHQTTAGWSAFTQLVSHYPVGIIYGQEIPIVHGGKIAGHVLCLFLKEPVTGTHLPSILEQVKKQDGLVSIAHPFAERRHEFRAYELIDDWSLIAIEVMNGRCYHLRDNEMAETLANRLHTPITAGSDAHTPFEVGTVYLECDCRNAGDLKHAIRNRDVQIGGKVSSMLFSVLSEIGRLGVSI